jgi:hypothetical protein
MSSPPATNNSTAKPIIVQDMGHCAMKDTEHVGRAALLCLSDAVVKLFNDADFESLMSLLALTCCEKVVVKACLQVLPSSNNRISTGVLISDDRVLAYIAQESSTYSIALTCMLLQSIHPDGVMKIIDKRICYQSYKARGVNPTSPTSVMEVVVMLRGSRVVPRCLHELLQEVTIEQRNAQEQLSPCSQHISAVQASEREFSASRTAVVSTGYGASSAEVIVLSTVVGKCVTKRCGDANDSCHEVDDDDDTYEGHGWRYLIEFKLLFDKHDLVTQWTTTMLAAEPEKLI